jgi:hypothetical protein
MCRFLQMNAFLQIYNQSPTEYRYRKKLESKEKIYAHL